MEIGNSHHSSIGAHTVLDVALYSLAWLFVFISELSADDVWKWSWRIASAISLALIIYINWNKALEIFKAKRNKDGNSKG